MLTKSRYLKFHSFSCTAVSSALPDDHEQNNCSCSAANSRYADVEPCEANTVSIGWAVVVSISGQTCAVWVAVLALSIGAGERGVAAAVDAGIAGSGTVLALPAVVALVARGPKTRQVELR